MFESVLPIAIGAIIVLAILRNIMRGPPNSGKNKSADNPLFPDRSHADDGGGFDGGGDGGGD